MTCLRRRSIATRYNQLQFPLLARVCKWPKVVSLVGLRGSVRLRLFIGQPER